MPRIEGLEIGETPRPRDRAPPLDIVETQIVEILEDAKRREDHTGRLTLSPETVLKLLTLLSHLQTLSDEERRFFSEIAREFREDLKSSKIHTAYMQFSLSLVGAGIALIGAVKGAESGQVLGSLVQKLAEPWTSYRSADEVWKKTGQDVSMGDMNAADSHNRQLHEAITQARQALAELQRTRHQAATGR